MFAPPLCVLPDNYSNMTFIALHAQLLLFMTYETVQFKHSTGTDTGILADVRPHADITVLRAKVWPAGLCVYGAGLWTSSLYR